MSLRLARAEASGSTADAAAEQDGDVLERRRRSDW